MTSRRKLSLEALEGRLLLAAEPVISEFLASNGAGLRDGDGNSSDWVEVRNRGDMPVDLSGYSLTDDAADLTRWQFPSTQLDPGEYLVVFASGQPMDDYIDPLGNLHTNFALRAGGEYLALVAPDGLTIVSEFSADGSDYPPQERDISYGTSEDGTSEGYFLVPTPGEANSTAPVPIPNRHIVITELMYHPRGAVDAEEFIEIFNASANSQDLGGWRFDDGVDFTFPARSLGAGEYLVIAADLAAFTAKYPGVTNVVGGWEGRLSNSGERIALVDQRGLLVDEVTYADEGAWAQREAGVAHFSHTGWVWANDHDGDGKSLELINHLVANDHGQNWRASADENGSPGRVNGVSDTNTAPLILDVLQSPIIPRSTDQVIVTARIDGDAVSSSSVRWRVDGRSRYSDAPLRDDGQGADRFAGDGVYAAMLPPVADMAVVEYFIHASDEDGNERTWPAATTRSGQVTNLLYQVDDTFMPQQAWDPGSDPVIRLIMTDVDRAELAAIGDTGDNGPRNEHNSNAQMNGTFVYVDGTGVNHRHNVGIRNRGHGSRSGPPNNYRVNFPHDDPWEGVTALNINSRVPYSQIVGSALYNRAGLVTANAHAATVLVNGMDLAFPSPLMFGKYAVLEVADGDFVRNHFPADADGNLYAARRVSGVEADFADRAPDPVLYERFYAKQTNAAENDWSDLFALTDVLNNAPEESYVEDVGRIVNIDQWLRVLALDTLVGNNETGLSHGIGDDFNLYRGVTDSRFVIVAHDLDSLLSALGGVPNRSIYAPSNVAGLERFFAHPEIRSRYQQTILDLVENVYNPAVVHPLLDRLIGDWVADDRLARMKDFVLKRTSEVLAQFPQELTVTSQLPIVDGYYHTSSPTFAPTLSVPPATHSLTLNGHAALYDSRVNEWRIRDTPSQEQTLVRRSSRWRYLDDGSDQGTAWRRAEFDDAAWRPGDAPLGYGDGDEATIVSFGADADNKHVTTYFRHAFEVTSVGELAEARLEIQRDDGVAVYLNGTLVAWDNLALGARYDEHATVRVADRDENAYHTFAVNPALLRRGTNVLSVEVHQFDPGSPDLSFDLGFIATRAATSAVPLLPGVNRVIVQAWDIDAMEIARQEIDVWYEQRPQRTIGGVLAGNTRLSRRDGPWLVTERVFVPRGSTLTIEPGTVVYFAPDTGIEVSGRLIAEGGPGERILLTREPDSPESWLGLRFINTPEDNRLSYVDMEYADGRAKAIEVVGSRLLIDNAAWLETNDTIIEVEHPFLTVVNSVLPGISRGEVIHGGAIVGEEYLVLRGNTFEKTSSGGDVIDLLVAEGPQPPVRVFDNVFLGGTDDGIDLDGVDALIEGNLFMDFRLDGQRTTTSNAVATGLPQNGHSNRSDVILRHNIFVNNDHHVLLKEDAFLTSEHNVFVGAHVAAVQFNEVGGTANLGPSRGGTFAGDIFWQNAELFVHQERDMTLSVQHSRVPLEALALGPGNIVADPLFVNEDEHDFRLAADSPARGTGPDDKDMGAFSRAVPLQAREVGGTLSADTTFFAAAGPYLISSDLTVPQDVTLTIEPGTSLFFDRGVSLNVQGRLIAVGTEYAQIRFTRTPGRQRFWGGIHFSGTQQDNRIAWAVIERALDDEGSVGVNASRLTLDHVTFRHSRLRRIHATNASLVVTNSVFDDVDPPGEAPLTDNVSEQIFGSGIMPGGEFLIQNNVFGTTTGHNDVIDFSGPGGPGPMLQVIGNTFHGSGDEILDLGGDAHIEGNFFSHVHKDVFNTSTGNANAISTGDDSFPATITVVRNVFLDIDHVLYLKNETFAYFEHNVVVGIPNDTEGQQYSAINMLIPGRDLPGRGAYLDSNLFVDVPQRIFGHLDEGAPGVLTDLVMHRTLVPSHLAGELVGNRGSTVLDLGEDNLATDPLLVDPLQDWSLLPDSPARKRGANGLDAGANVPSGASIAGEPRALTHEDSATLTIGGPGITHYRYALNDEPFGDVQRVPTPIRLVDLADGTYQVRVIGRNRAGTWQSESSATISAAWRVQRGLHGVVISEVLARNESTLDINGTTPDLIELYNPGANEVDLSGMRLSDDLARPDRFVFEPGTRIAPGEYMLLVADANVSETSIHLGFALNGEGGGVYLFDARENGGDLVDAVEYGAQAADFSIARVGQQDTWGLAQPTLGAPNQVQRTGDPSALRINEWFAHGDVRLEDDFVEIFNADTLPVDISQFTLSDAPNSQADRHRFADLSFVAPQGRVSVEATGRRGRVGEADFRLASRVGRIALFDAEHQLLDFITYMPQTTDISQGRFPEGGRPWEFFALPTPGAANASLRESDVRQLLALMNDLRITEIMYNPPGGANLEFVEIANVGDQTLNLEGVRVAGGIEYDFGDLPMVPGQLVLLVNNQADFAARYGAISEVVGEYEGNLNNGGEEIRLQMPNPYDAAILRFSYDDDRAQGWPSAADGGGRSLEIVDPQGDYRSPSNWRASTNVLGTPGFGGIRPADFNRDGAVGDDDFAIWQINFGVTRHALHGGGDADGSGSVAGNDFLLWQTQRDTRGVGGGAEARRELVRSDQVQSKRAPFSTQSGDASSLRKKGLRSSVLNDLFAAFEKSI